MFQAVVADIHVRLRAATRAVFLLALLAVFFAARTQAHEGHDHSPPASSLPVTTLPRAVATGDEFEAVAVLKGDRLAIFVDRFGDNSPVTKAGVTITVGKSTLTTQQVDDGSYSVIAPALREPGRHDLVIAIQDGAVSDLLIATLDTPPASAAGPSGSEPAVVDATRLTNTWTAPVLLLVAAIIILTVGLRKVWGRRTPKAAKAKSANLDQATLGLLLAVGVSASALTNETATAHGDEDHSAAKPGATASTILPLLQGDSPRRLPDGTVFLPKPTQRLLDVRTLLAKEASQTPRQSFVGRVIANPNRSGLVQSSSGGRIVPPATGLPMLGQAVKAGDVLASVTPGSLAIGSANVVQIAGDVDQQIALAKTRLERARKLFATNAGTRVAVEEAELQLQGLERRRADIDTSEVKSETLVAPVDGVISAARAVPGQVVAPNDILFEIIDTSSLWVEAFVFDAAGSAAFKDPIASTGDGRTLPLTFLGRSRSLRQQSAILQFEIIERATGLDVGALVTVHALSGDPVTGVVLPRSAVVRAANGEDIVWRHTEPERFVATPVRVSTFDGAHVLVQAGLASGERIVVQGAELINQVR